MVAVVKSLDTATSVDTALEANGVAERNRPKYLVALTSLLASDMIVPTGPDSSAEPVSAVERVATHAC